MNAKSLFLGHQFERADFADTEGATRPMFWITDFPPNYDESQLMFLHRIVRVPADEIHAMNDADIEDEMVSNFLAFDMLLVALFVVLGIALSIYKPWQWFQPMDLEGVYQAAATVVRGWLG